MELGRDFMGRLTIWIALLATFVSSSSAKSAEFKIHQADYGSVEIIILGELVAGDEVKFRNLVNSVIQQDKWIERVVTYTMGDAVPTAMNIGEQVYTLRAGAWAPLDWGGSNEPKHFICQEGGLNLENFPDSHKGDPRCTCTGACFFIWAAGRGRNGGVVGISGIRFDPKSYGRLSVADAKSLYDRTRDEDEKYLQKMGIPDAIAELPFMVGSENTWYLKSQEVAPLVGIASPYIRELARTRCGDYTASTRQSDGRAAWWKCFYQIREEEVRIGMSEWKKKSP